MWHIVILKFLSFTLIFTPFSNVSCIEESNHEFSNQDWTSNGQYIAAHSLLLRQLESQTQRLVYTENVLRRALSLMLTNARYSAVQNRLEADSIINSFLSNDPDLFAHENEEIEEAKPRWKRQVTSGFSLGEDSFSGFLDSSKPNQLIAPSSGRSGDSLSGSLENTDIKPQNVTIPPEFRVNENSTSEEAPLNASYAASDRNGTALKFEDQLVTQKNLRDVVNGLRNAMKCSLAQRNSDNPKELLGALTELSINFNENGSMSMQFQLKTCLKFWNGAWVNITRTSPAKLDGGAPINLNASVPAESYFYRIPKNCFKRKGLYYSIEIPSNSSTQCHFERLSLRECHVYHVEVQGVFLELQGTPTTLDIIFLPRDKNEKINVKTFNASANSSSLTVEWAVNSNVCAAILSSVNLKINEDAIHKDEPAASYSYSIPGECIHSYEREDILFWTTLFQLSSKNTSCSIINWKPLDNCRKYRLELTPEYSSLRQGNTSSTEVFTSSKMDSYCCQYLTEENGSIDLIDQRLKDCSWQISAKKGQQIWFLSARNRIPCSIGKLRVFDGSYETSPLLAEFCDETADSSIRSRSNNIFVKLVPNPYNSYEYHYNSLSFYFHYAMVKASSTPFIPGCGGYIIENGSISKPSYPPIDESSTSCLFYIRSSDKTSTFSIISNYGKVPFPMIVYADWTKQEQLYSYNNTNQTDVADESTSKLAVYSAHDYMLVEFPAWNLAERGKELSWSIQKNLTGCYFNLTSDIGSIESPNYPQPYQPFTDCRWVIQPEGNAIIRLTLVYVDLIGVYDYLTVYDGATLNSGILKELSGRLSKPITITTKNNALLVRLTSSQQSGKQHGQKRFGFLGIYTTIN